MTSNALRHALEICRINWETAAVAWQDVANAYADGNTEFAEIMRDRAARLEQMAVKADLEVVELKAKIGG